MDYYLLFNCKISLNVDTSLINFLKYFPVNSNLKDINYNQSIFINRIIINICFN